MTLFRWLTLPLVLMLGACSADLPDYKNSDPRFDLFGYFEGETKAWGMVQDYTNKQNRRFDVTIVGTVQNNKLVLVEDFVFDDGEIDQRIWTIEKLKDGSYRGVADDIIGAAIGKEEGNALQWQYDFELKVDGSTYTVAFDDWLYRQDDKHVFNLTSIRKFGIEVGKITLFFQKQ
ncbi:DUF3833 domain-containing protein [Vibrio barjaei]|uniref:DUF3833 domain-containing protein n=1 Tax=Vibrio barjaei TaxID=1676683 RepID=A0ABW7IKM4_9VIBR|nr:DUF3833 domain-containing protein [Vibrio barjaei]MCG9786387.1 DUF3833 domain-containing protein [Vibrio mediterranei]MCY9869822.1 DUF3833 domain-containing protein [Vibrio barjaei]